MPGLWDNRKEKALMQAFEGISRFLGKEEEYREYHHYMTNDQRRYALPEDDKLARHTPAWIQLPPTLRQLYDIAYNNGFADGSGESLKPGRD